MSSDLIVQGNCFASETRPALKECRLLPDLFAALDARFGPFEIDLFADMDTFHTDSASGHSLPFFSRFPEPHTEGVDVLHMDWLGMTDRGARRLYAFPPPAVLDKVVAKCTAGPV